MDQVDVQTTFFELNDNSLLLFQVHQQLLAMGALAISPVHLLQFPTIHRLAEFLDEQLAKQSRADFSVGEEQPDGAAPEYVQASHDRAQRQLAARQRMKRTKKEPPR